MKGKQAPVKFTIGQSQNYKLPYTSGFFNEETYTKEGNSMYDISVSL